MSDPTYLPDVLPGSLLMSRPVLDSMRESRLLSEYGTCVDDRAHPVAYLDVRELIRDRMVESLNKVPGIEVATCEVPGRLLLLDWPRD